MEIDFNNPLEDNGFLQREIAIEGESPSGHRERVTLVVWATASDSRASLNAASRVAGIALLERALEALRRA